MSEWRNGLRISYEAMIARCYCKTSHGYSNYGEKGITVCDEWKNSYTTFKKWALEHNWQEGLTLDRINNKLGYFPENCRWVSRRAQARNRSTTILIDGTSLREKCELLGIKYTTVWDRIYKHNWSIEKALNTPIRFKRS